MRLEVESQDYERFLNTASTFWQNNLPPEPGDKWIIVEALHHQARNILRNLTIANALRRVEPARILVITGTDDGWYETVWADFNVETVRQLSQAYAACEVVNVHDLADSGATAVEVAGRRIGIGEPELDPADLDACADASVCRLDRTPRLDGNPRFRPVRDRTAAFASIYEAFFRDLDVVALITSHVDYYPWGTAVEAATRSEVPIIHVQSTGSLKAYCLFPETRRGEATFRAELTGQIGDYFERYLWPNRELLKPSAELVAWRSRSNLGRPAWWRFGSEAMCELTNAAERAQFRDYAMSRQGFDPRLPVVAVFNHAVSDALGCNREIFGDLAEWFEETVGYARATREANWLLLDHPQQAKYDATGFFERLADRHRDAPHLRFMSSLDLSKNALWSMTDLGVTVRGSVSNELPAFGTPVIQAGWSEWSACGLSTVAADRDSYWKALTSSVEALSRGESPIGDEQVERARLWLWLYRSGADVPSPIAPHWSVMPEPLHLRTIELNMRSMESDAEPAFTAVRRMWTRREPLLTRFDLTSPRIMEEHTS